MAVTAKNLTYGNASSPGSSTTTATISPGANKLILITVGTNGSFANPVTSVTGCGLTFVIVATQLTSDSRQRMTLLRAMSPTPTSGALTINVTGGSNEITYVVSEFDNVDTTGTNGANAIVQTVTAINESLSGSGTVSITLGSFTKTDNATFGAIRINGVTPVTPGSGFTELAQNSSVHTMEQEFKNTNDTSVDWGFSNLTGRIIMIAAELKFTSKGGAFLYNII